MSTDITILFSADPRALTGTERDEEPVVNLTGKRDEAMNRTSTTGKTISCYKPRFEYV